MTHRSLLETGTAPVRGAVSARAVPGGRTGTLIAAGVLQVGQALVWMFVGLLVGTGDGASRGEPVAVVLLIAAILAFSVGGFALALAAGTLGRSDVCRIASVVFQVVFGGVIIAGSIDLIRSHSATGLTISLDPTTGPAFGVSTGLIVVMLSTCVAALALLMCRQSSWATRRR